MVGDGGDLVLERSERVPLGDEAATKGPTVTGTDRAVRIHEVGTVFVPVTDQERALAFYTDKLDFEKRADFPYGNGSRWVELAPPGSANAIALVPPSEGLAHGTKVTHCAFATDDIDADYAALRARGVEVDDVIGLEGTRRPGLVSKEVGIESPQPPQFHFSDPDGNRFLIVEV
jgi:catechol 2,3-dioxygenase-like lactoylglutathione lyase family enzyme